MASAGYPLKEAVEPDFMPGRPRVGIYSIGMPCAFPGTCCGCLESETQQKVSVWYKVRIRLVLGCCKVGLGLEQSV